MRMLTIAVTVLALALLAGCKSTTVEGEAGKKLTIEQPGEVSLVRGGTAEVKIKIRRVNLMVPVTISFEKLPGGVEVVEAGQKIAGTEGTYFLKAGEAADLVSNYLAQVTATAEGGLGATETIKITVTEKK